MSRQDQYTSTSKKEELYSDFHVDLNPHPEAGDVVRYVNENAVKRSLRNLILTNRYERLFQPDIGSNINKLLFEPMGFSTANSLKNFIIETITNHEPRCKLIDVVIIPNEDNHAYQVNIVFSIINKQDPINLAITLYRVR